MSHQEEKLSRSPYKSSRHTKHYERDSNRRSRSYRDSEEEINGEVSTKNKSRRSSSPEPRGHNNSSRPYRKDRGNPRSRSRSRSRSPRRSYQSSRRRKSRSRSPLKAQDSTLRSRMPLASQEKAFNKTQDLDTPPATEKEKPNFAPSGRLAAASNTVQTAGQTIVLKYHEPAEARKPPTRDTWRMYVFKNDDIVDTVQLSEQSCWLFGRELAVVDIPIEHPSASKQHAVIQFRYIEKRNDFGDKVGKVKPYLLDLESAHGSFVNHERLPDAKYFELKNGDMIKFGQSKREYVIQLPRN